MNRRLSGDDPDDEAQSASLQASEYTPLLDASPITSTADPKVAPARTATGTESISEAVTLNNSDNEHEDDDEPEEDKLPGAQIAYLCFARLVEPIAFFGIFPFIGPMVQRNGHLAEADIGFYSGVIESLFSLTQVVVMIRWGRLADRIGRRPVLIVSLFGVATATMFFGFAQTIWQMILLRCLAGVFAGSIVTIRTMISELSTKKTQAKAFSYFAFTGNLGIFLGPLIGGALADPAGQYPRVFKGLRFFETYPFALPTITVGIVAYIAAITTLIFVEETKVRPSMTNKSVAKPSSSDPNRSTTRQSAAADDDDADTESLSSSSSSSSPDPNKPMTTMELLRQPGVKITIWVSSHVMLLGTAYTVVVPIFWYTSPELGGFGFSPVYISIFMAMTGLVQAIWLLIVFPRLHKRVGTRGILRLCGYAYPFVFIFCCPAMNVLLRIDTPISVTLFWVALPILLSLGVGVSMAFTVVQLAVNDISPGPASLGTLNAIALTASTGVRAFGPALFTSIFALSARTQILWGYLIWVVMIVLALAWNVAIRYLPPKALGIEDPSGRRR